jgi:hypothetical protein
MGEQRTADHMDYHLAIISVFESEILILGVESFPSLHGFPCVRVSCFLFFPFFSVSLRVFLSALLLFAAPLLLLLDLSTGGV